MWMLLWIYIHFKKENSHVFAFLKNMNAIVNSYLSTFNCLKFSDFQGMMTNSSSAWSANL